MDDAIRLAGLAATLLVLAQGWESYVNASRRGLRMTSTTKTVVGNGLKISHVELRPVGAVILRHVQLQVWGPATKVEQQTALRGRMDDESEPMTATVTYPASQADQVKVGLVYYDTSSRWARSTRQVAERFTIGTDVYERWVWYPWPVRLLCWRWIGRWKALTGRPWWALRGAADVPI